MSKYNHIMVDIETLGTKSNSVLLSIGAVAFDPETGNWGKTYHEKIKAASCVKAGLKVDIATVEWWLSQDDEAIDRLFDHNSAVDLAEAIDSFTGFFLEVAEELEPEDEIYIWGNSNRFDMGLLENAWNALDFSVPWKFRNELDVRTLCHFMPHVKNEVMAKAKKAGVVTHDALNDCFLQIDYVSKIYNTITTCLTTPKQQ